VSKNHDRPERETDEDLLASDFEFLDKNNLDVKFDYLLQKSMKQNTYNITGYVFIPTELKINKDSYSKQNFFHDFQSFIRFQTPIFPLAALTKPENTLSPLNRMKEILNQRLSGKLEDEELNKRMVYELKLHAQIVRSNLRRQIVSLIELARQSDSSDLVRQDVMGLFDSINKIEGVYRDIQQILFNMQIPERTRATFLAADEYMLYYVEHYFTVLLNDIQRLECYSDLIPDLQVMI
jgi:hypothetical protein